MAVVNNRKNYWGIILAGGEGTRVQTFLRSHYGAERPKQFCAIVGTRSMLRHTFDRARTLIPRENILTIINSDHIGYIDDALEGEPRENIIVQPTRRETAPGILLPLLHAYHRDPDARVALFPSDHFIWEEGRFMEHVEEALALTGRHSGRLTLLGIPPDRCTPGYGWIETMPQFESRKMKTTAAIAPPVWRVRRFWEKPPREKMIALFRRGCLWNTLTMVGTARTILSLFYHYTPALFSAFTPVWHALGTPTQGIATACVYAALPPLNFSHAVLERATRYLDVMRVDGVYWSDWGEQDRILSDLERFGYRRPATAAASSATLQLPPIVTESAGTLSA